MHGRGGHILYACHIRSDYSIGVLVYGLVVNNYGIVKTLKGIGSVYKQHPVTVNHEIHAALNSFQV